jgi:hypothetical protein
MSPPPRVMLSYDPNSVGHGKGRLLMERSDTVRVIYHIWVSPLRLFSHFLQAIISHCNLTPDIVKICWLAPMVFPSRVGKVFHVKSHVSFAV